MSFSEILKGITQDVKGARGAAVVGMDGIIVDEYLVSPEADMQSLSAEYGNILKEVQQASLSLQLGSAKEFAVMTDRSNLIISRINDDYFLSLLISPNASLGKGRFKARVAAMRLEKEF
jgi:predicted regulator of Ras-like GTPase activity (Roadblock/LC7/MglB family)